MMLFPLLFPLLFQLSSSAQLSISGVRELPSRTSSFSPPNSLWVGGDSSASLCPPDQGFCWWIWADTLLGTVYMNETTSMDNRNLTGMPHNSLSVLDLGSGEVEFLGSPFGEGSVEYKSGLFRTDDFPESYLWPINGVNVGTPGGDIDIMVIMSMRVSSVGFLNITTSSMVLVDGLGAVKNPERPERWEYEVVDVPSGRGEDGGCEVYWTLGTVVEGDWLYIAGGVRGGGIALSRVGVKNVEGREKNINIITGISSISGEFFEYLTPAGWSSMGEFVPENLQSILPADADADRPDCTEGTIDKHPSLGIYYFVCLQAGDPRLLFAYTDSESIGDVDARWNLSYPYAVPGELSDGFPLSAYAAKSHPALAGDDTVVVSYNTNTNAGFEGLTNSTVGYHPRFVELTLEWG